MKVSKSYINLCSKTTEFKNLIKNIHQSSKAHNNRNLNEIANCCKVAFSLGNMLIEKHNAQRINSQYNYYIDKYQNPFVILSKHSKNIHKYFCGYDKWTNVKYILLYEYINDNYEITSKKIIGI